MSFILSITPEQTAFNDPNIYTCYIDGYTFTDPGVYQQHMLMYHGLSVDVRAQDNSIIKAPDNPVISQPIGSVAPGVTLTPVPGLGPGYYTPVETVYSLPGSVLDTSVKLKPVIATSGQGSGSAWAMAGIIGAIVAFGWTRPRSRKSRK